MLEGKHHCLSTPPTLETCIGSVQYLIVLMLSTYGIRGLVMTAYTYVPLPAHSYWLLCFILCTYLYCLYG